MIIEADKRIFDCGNFIHNIHIVYIHIYIFCIFFRNVCVDLYPSIVQYFVHCYPIYSTSRHAQGPSQLGAVAWSTVMLPRKNEISIVETTHTYVYIYIYLGYSKIHTTRFIYIYIYTYVYIYIYT